MGKVKSKKRKRSTSSEDSSSSSSSDSSREKKKLRKLKKKLRKEQKKTEKVLKKKLKEKKKKLREKRRSKSDSCSRDETGNSEKLVDKAADIPIELMERSKAMAPMTKEEWEKRQSVVRRVLDEESGRYRLIKGDGEVLEEIVSRDRHLQINRQATATDGAFFQANTVERKRL